jgi:hypothetical protein
MAERMHFTVDWELLRGRPIVHKPREMWQRGCRQPGVGWQCNHGRHSMCSKMNCTCGCHPSYTRLITEPVQL